MIPSAFLLALTLTPQADWQEAYKHSHAKGSNGVRLLVKGVTASDDGVSYNVYFVDGDKKIKIGYGGFYPAGSHVAPGKSSYYDLDRVFETHKPGPLARIVIEPNPHKERKNPGTVQYQAIEVDHCLPQRRLVVAITTEKAVKNWKDYWWRAEDVTDKGNNTYEVKMWTDVTDAHTIREILRVKGIKTAKIEKVLPDQAKDIVKP